MIKMNENLRNLVEKYFYNSNMGKLSHHGLGMIDGAAIYGITNAIRSGDLEKAIIPFVGAMLGHFVLSYWTFKDEEYRKRNKIPTIEDYKKALEAINLRSK